MCSSTTCCCAWKPSPAARLIQAVAVRQGEEPETALAEVNALAQDLEHYHLFHIPLEFG